MSNINQKLANLSLEQRALLERKLQQKNKTSRQQKIPRRGDRNLVPLSWAQERLWFLARLEGASATYNVSQAVRIAGNLNIDALKEALSTIISRHEVLRTSFPLVNDTPQQFIHPEVAIAIEIVNLQQHSSEKRHTLLEEIARQEATTPFNLEKVPLIRCKLIQLETAEYVLFLTMHHIISDGWSVGVFIKELSSLYQAICGGKSSPLPKLPIQYADFTLWQRKWLSEEVIETQLNYWKEQLADAPELLQLPTDRSRPNAQTYQGNTQAFTLDANLTQKLQVLSRKSGTTIFMTLYAAFATLLYRYSGQNDIVIGSPIANRNRREIEDLIGFFVNNLVLRTRFTDNLSFKDLLAQVKETTLQAYKNQDVPFERVVEALQPQRSLSHSPLFQVLFVLQNTPVGEVELPDLTLSDFHLERKVSRFDLSLAMAETDSGLVGEWQYSTDLFDRNTIERLTTHFQNLLKAIADNPSQTVDELTLLSEPERQKLLIKWNDTATNYPQDKSIHKLFEEQVAKTPNAVAVVFEEQQLTYQQLNQQANQLVHYLQKLGVKPETLVGICLERSLEMVVGLLGILKAGGAYVPLDPNYPQDRLSYMLADSQVEVLLTEEKLKASLPLERCDPAYHKGITSPSGASGQTPRRRQAQGNADQERESASRQRSQLVCLDSDWEQIAQQSQENLDLEITADNLAYVIYTSGSTGVPKGVPIEHRGVVRLVKETNYASFTSDEIFLQLAPISFDASTFEIWGSLLNGAKLVVMCAHTPTLSEIAQAIAKHQITTLWLTAALFHLMVEQQLDKLKSIRQLLAGGDVLSPTHVAKAIKSLPGCRLINGYGPTENTTFTCCYTVEELTEITTIPIGRPISNTQVYILDSQLQPVPIGVSGELYIGGDGLARGYLNLPELTKERFISIPPTPLNKGGVKGWGIKDRLYKTGDLARYLTDGNIEFLGRIDRQVKIQGFRIELGEIEAVLNTHPQVKQSAVIVTEDSSGDKHLVSYVAGDRQSLTVKQLREFLKQKLPEYMLPNAFVILDALPITANGKLDRKALPAPDGVSQSDESIAPRTLSEEIIANVFALVLDMENVGVDDDFFEWGGNSLQAVKLVSIISKETGCDISIRQIFEHSTVAQLATVLDRLQEEKQTVSHTEVISKKCEVEEKSAPDYCQVESRSLLSLFAAGGIAAVDSAALAYLPLDFLTQSGLSRDEIIQGWFQDLPVWQSVLDTPWGRIALISLPIFADEIYDNPKKLLESTLKSLHLASNIGGKTVSLTGLIPSATDYGRTIFKAIENNSNLPAITTGHDVTCSAVVLNISKILRLANRSLEAEKVGFIGLGSIGLSSLRLMLTTLPHPSHIMLCDLYSKMDVLEQIRQELIEELNFSGVIELVAANPELPQEIYDATLIVGATNVPDILDIDRLSPHTLIVDDSGPHIFSPEKAMERFERDQDILFTEGGMLQSSQINTIITYCPPQVQEKVGLDWLDRFNPQQITSCVLSSLLCSKFDNLSPIIGMTDRQNALECYQTLVKLGFEGADLHCDRYVLNI